MAKGFAPIFFMACGVVVAGIIGYSFLKSEPVIDAQKSTLIEPVEQAKLKEQVLPKQVEEKQVEEKSEIDISIKPRFDVLRVERDGSAVVAGRAKENQKIELVDGDKVLAETKTNKSGEFAIVLDEPLTPGSHELFLRMVPENDERVLSSSFAFVDVPEIKTLGGVTVLLAEVGKPSQILQKPEATPNKVVSNKAEESVSIAKPKPEEVEKVVAVKENEQTASVEQSQTNANGADDVKETNVVEIPVVEIPKEIDLIKPEQTDVIAAVLIGAADIEAGKIFIAGTGEPKSTINLYMDNELLGAVEVGDNGAFLFEGRRDVKSGRYEIRADMTRIGETQVIARAEVNLIHEPKIAAISQPKLLEPKPDIKQKPLLDTKLEQAVDVPESIEQTEPETEVASADAKPEVGFAEEDKKEIRTGSAVIIRRGDSLWTVARRNYGSGIRYTTIFDANRDQVRNPNKIFPGQILKIPDNAQSE